MLFLGGLLFVAAEVAAFIEVGEHIGFGWAVLLLFGVSLLGPLIIRRAGSGVLARTQERLTRGELPTREVLDGVVVLVAGTMICVPGFISDAIGISLMVPPVRHLLIRSVGHHVARRVRDLRPRRGIVVDVAATSEQHGEAPSALPPGRPAAPDAPTADG